jgi:iron complex transport system substrate-binding protein
LKGATTLVRRFALLLTLVAMLGACAPAPAAQRPTAAADPTAAPTAPGAAQPEAPTSAAASPFPVTIAHKFGETAIPAAPERVVALGYTDQDPILALGVAPVAVRYYFGDAEDQLWPWAEGAAGGGSPQVLNVPFGELNAEAIAALQPDLIVAVSAGITDADYATLSQIAPTLAQSADYVDFGVPWQEQTRVIGRALGRAARAEELVAATEARFAELRAAHPEFAGATAAIAAPAADGQFFFSGPEHERQRVLTALGFTLPEELAGIAGDSFYGTISGERLDLLDTDVLIVTASPSERAALEANPIFQQLDVVKAGRVITLDTSGTSDDLIGPALVYSSVLSLPVVFDELVPQLAEALGDVSAAPASGQFPLAITHARGTTTLDAPARRVVALEWTYVENLLALGVQPIGVADIAGYNDWVSVPVALDPAARDVGTRQEPNLEQIAALKPDLIIAPSFRVDANYAELNAIAPTVAFDPYPADEALTQYDEMLRTFRAIAQIVGREAEGEAILAQMESTFVAQAERVASAGAAGEPFVLAQAFSGGSGAAEVRLFTENALATQVVERLGLVNAWEDAAFQQYGFSTVSVEALPALGEARFFYVVQDEDDVFAAAAVRPLWERLPFVQAGKAHALGGDTWLFGGPLSAELLATLVADTMLAANE